MSEQEIKLAEASTDDAPSGAVLMMLVYCAGTWNREARIVGNIRAGDICRVITDLQSQLTEAQEAARTLGHQLNRRASGNDLLTQQLMDRAEKAEAAFVTAQEEINRLNEKNESLRRGLAKAMDLLLDTPGESC